MNRKINQSVLFAVTLGIASILFPSRAVAAEEVTTETFVQNVMDRPMMIENVPANSVVIKRTIKTIERPALLEGAATKSVIIEKTVDRPLLLIKTIERPVIIERTVDRPLLLEKPVVVEKTIQKVIDRPAASSERVEIERTIHVPVVIVRDDWW